MSTISSTLLEQDVPAEPIRLFGHWYAAAEAAKLPEPSAMTLATASPDGVPDARMVLMRGFDERGITFFTNYESCKAAQLKVNPRVALIFFWPVLMRQIRVLGSVERVTAEESDAYFRSRPFGHRLGALVSPQSQVIPGRQILEDRLKLLLEQYQPTDEVPRPGHWGGFRVLPSSFEFWQGRDNRLHDRLRYRRDGEGWKIERLAP